jgi:MFS family permease
MNYPSTKLWSFSFFSACIANFLMGFSFYLLIPTLPFFLVERFTIDKGLTGIILSCYVIAALLIRPFSGFMVDKYARKPLYILSFVLFVAFTAGYLVAGGILLFIILRFWHGITWGIITTAGNTLAIDIMPSAKRGEGIGYYGLSLTIAMAIGPMAGLFLYEHYTFDYIFYAAILSGFIGLVFASFIKAPERLPVIHQPFSLDRFILTKSIPVGINVIFITLSYGMILSFAAMYGKEKGISNTGLLFTLMAIGMAVSRIFSGKLIDRGKIRFILILGIIVLSSGFGLFTISSGSTLYFTSSLIMGLGYGVLFPAFQSLFINLGTHQQRGTANSTFFTAFDLGVGGGMILAGKIAEIASLSFAFGICTAACILSLLFFIKITSPYYNKNKLV